MITNYVEKLDHVLTQPGRINIQVKVEQIDRDLAIHIIPLCSSTLKLKWA